MANFDLFEDEFVDIFLTQQSRGVSSVSLEEIEDQSGSFPTLFDPQYSDISDVEEEDASSGRIR